MKSNLRLVSALCTSFAHPIRWTALALPIAIVAQSLVGTPALADELAAENSATAEAPAATLEPTPALTPEAAALATADLLDQLAAELRGTPTPAPAPTAAPASPLLLSPADRLNPGQTLTPQPAADPALEAPATETTPAAELESNS
ncbi:MAG: hypothetical protein ACO331_08960 [Prochlorothrix sp.]